MSFPDKAGEVYSLEFPDGKKYVGVTTIGMRKRLNNHNSNPSQTSKISKAVKEHGIENIKVEILDTFSCKEEACELEQKYIIKNNSVLNGYNSSAGGPGTIGLVPTEEQRYNMSAAQKKRFTDPFQRQRLGENIVNWIKENPEKHQEVVNKRKITFSDPEYRKRISLSRKKIADERPEIGVEHSEFMKERYKSNPELRLQVSRSKGGTPVEVYKDFVFLF